MKSRTLVLWGLAILLVLGIVSLVRNATSPMTLQERVQRDSAAEKSRFLPENSIDISMAMKLVTHGPAEMLNPPTAPPPQLLYPPSAETLARMSGE